MLDDFFIRALLGGIGVVLIAGPLGCFIVWRRMSYFGDTLAHAALLGVTLSVLFDINAVATVFAVSLMLSLILLYLQRLGTLSSDALLGLLSHSALALGLIVIGLMASVRVNLMGLLFGDILAISKIDLVVIYGGGALILCCLAMIWKPLFAASVSNELALAEGVKTERANLIFMLLLASVIAISMKLIGVLLITAMLIIPAATARRFAGGPEMMAVIAALIGAVSTTMGLYGSLWFDTPSGPSIVVASLCFFILSLAPITKAVRGRSAT